MYINSQSTIFHWHWLQVAWKRTISSVSIPLPLAPSSSLPCVYLYCILRLTGYCVYLLFLFHFLFLCHSIVYCFRWTQIDIVTRFFAVVVVSAIALLLICLFVQLRCQIHWRNRNELLLDTPINSISIELKNPNTKISITNKNNSEHQHTMCKFEIWPSLFIPLKFEMFTMTYTHTQHTCLKIKIDRQSVCYKYSHAHLRMYQCMLKI